MMSDLMKHLSFGGKIWNSAVDEKSEKLYLIIRNDQEVFAAKIDLISLQYEKRKLELSKWTQLLGVDRDVLCFIEYQDEHDPNKFSCFSYHWENTTIESLSDIPSFSDMVTYPSIFEHGSEYHKTVEDFLSVELAHSCEYLEWKDKIIISYYLRSGSIFDRYLLMLNDGTKEFKLCQDKEMKGFSPGSFFVFNKQLIFIKDQHEVCVYTG